ncbi:MAG: hypothetical protein ACRCTE_11440, partial [Cellulosilyticaceae bacterium]
ISESFNLVRWCLIVIVFAFVAIVSVAKYIQLSDVTTITYSSFEITYLILNDTISIVYIYLPLYLFMICGLMFDDNFGSLEIVKSGSRGKWLGSKYITLLFYTVCFFILLAVMNFLISNQVFAFSDKWSSDFMNMQVLQGQNPKDFVHGPLETIGLSLGSVFLLYVMAGTVSLWLSLITQKEAFALLGSLVVGILMSMVFVYGLDLTSQKNMQAFMGQVVILLTMIGVAYGSSLSIARKKDFQIERKQ